MLIREYKESDERGWVRCRVVSFLDCSYFDDVKRHKQRYEHADISLVVVDCDEICVLIDVEYEETPGQVCTLRSDKRGAVIWNLAVLPEYRRLGCAGALWDRAMQELILRGVRRCEVWTQGDAAANAWYQRQGFQNVSERNWLRCYAGKGSPLIQTGALGDIYGVEQLVFHAPIQRYDELRSKCNRIDEVRLYAMDIDKG